MGPEGLPGIDGDPGDIVCLLIIIIKLPYLLYYTCNV